MLKANRSDRTSRVTRRVCCQKRGCPKKVILPRIACVEHWDELPEDVRMELALTQNMHPASPARRALLLVADGWWRGDHNV